MFDDHPFKKESKAGLTNVIRCPKCKTLEYDAHQNEFEIFYDCRKCGNRWSGGSMGAGRTEGQAPPPQGVPAPDDDLPVNSLTSSLFRPWE